MKQLIFTIFVLSSFNALAADPIDPEGFNTPGLCFDQRECTGTLILENATRIYCIETRHSQSWFDLDKQVCVNL